MSVLEVNDIHKSFNGIEVLKGISFSLRKGEVLAILGPSGGGKTTLLRCINNLETPDTGTIEGEVRGLVFQQFNLFPQYTVWQNIQLAPKLLNKYTQEELDAKTESLLKKVDMSDKKDFYPWQLSGGQQQRVAIARALAMEPGILCFDEPTSSLDPELTGEVLKVIQNLKSKDTSMILVTHEIEFAKECADNVIFMYGGKIEEQGTAKEIFQHPSSNRLKEFLR